MEFLKEMKELFKYGYYSARMGKYTKDIERMTKVDVIKDGFIEIFHNGFVIGSLARYAVLYVKEYDDHFIPVVIKESCVKKFSYNANQFINYHEVGHFEKHIDKKTGLEMTDTDLGLDLNVEHEADMYAVQKMGYDRVFEALNELIDRSDDLYTIYQFEERKQMLWEKYLESRGTI